MIAFKWILLYYSIVSIILFVLMGVDKHKAKKHKWRIPEKTLFFFSLIGGFFGGFAAMGVFHHKTRKIMFWVVFVFSLILHMTAIVLINKEFYLC